MLTFDFPLAGTIEAVGDGRVGERTQEFQLKAGETVVYSKFGIGATDLDVQGERYVLIREDDCIGIMPRAGATAADVPELRPVGDRVLLKVREYRSPRLLGRHINMHWGFSLRVVDCLLTEKYCFS